MTTKIIKMTVVILAMLLIASLLSGYFIAQKHESLLDLQVKMWKNFSLNKDEILELNNAYREHNLDYYKLDSANRKFLDDITKFSRDFPHNLKIKKIKDIAFRQTDSINLIKRENSMFLNSLHYMQNAPEKIFLSQNHHKNNLHNIVIKLIYLSYHLKTADNPGIKKYKSYIEEIKKTKISNKKLTDYKKEILGHFSIILQSGVKIRKNISVFNKLEDELIKTYHQLTEEIKIKDLYMQKSVEYSQIVLVTVLFIFILLISKLLQIEKKNKQEQKRLQALINKNIIISSTDLNGVITDVSGAFCKTSGYSKEELVGQTHRIINHPDMPKKIFKELWTTIQKEKIWKGNVKNRKKDGEYFWEKVVIEPIFNDKGKVTSYVSIRAEITDRISLEELTKNQEIIIKKQTELANRQRDKALKTLEVKSDFLANMSHEIRTPLNCILGFVDILKDNIKDKEDKRYLQTIDDSSHHLLGVINDILDISKMESGKTEIVNIDFDIKKEFKKIINFFYGQCLQKNIQLLLKFDDNLPEVINADSLRIKEVISNLLSNAIKFSKEDKNIEVKINFKDNYLGVSVRDEGKGIAKNKLKHIFNAFSQEDNSTTRQYGGTGLGLSISGNLVKLMGGELKVKSELSVGSEFYFYIPVTIGKSIIFEEKNLIEGDLKGHILLAEDNETNQEFMKIILKKLGLTFDIANDGVEAVEAFITNQYDCILMDENMPNMNGVEATKRILEIEKKKNLIHTPIIALTANSLKGDRERFLSVGMDEYLSKPVNKKKLHEVIGRFFKK